MKRLKTLVSNKVNNKEVIQLLNIAIITLIRAFAVIVQMLSSIPQLNCWKFGKHYTFLKLNSFIGTWKVHTNQKVRKNWERSETGVLENKNSPPSLVQKSILFSCILDAKTYKLQKGCKVLNFSNCCFM